MPKKRKTLQQKILTDQKRSVPSSPTTAPQEQAMQGVTFSLPTSQKAVQKTVTPHSETIAIATNEYTYLANDLMRTALLTVAIVIAELLIRFFIVHQ